MEKKVNLHAHLHWGLTLLSLSASVLLMPIGFISIFIGCRYAVCLWMETP